MQVMTNVRRDFIATCLRSQIDRLHGMLKIIEEENHVESDGASDGLKQIEKNLRRIRRFCILT